MNREDVINLLKDYLRLQTNGRKIRLVFDDEVIDEVDLLEASLEGYKEEVNIRRKGNRKTIKERFEEMLFPKNK